MREQRAPRNLDRAKSLFAKTRQSIQVSLDGLGATEVGRGAADKLKVEVGQLSGSVGRLATAVGERFEIAARRTQLVANAIAAHRQLADKTGPLADDANFNLMLGLRSAGDSEDREKNKAELERIADEDMVVLEGLSELRIESNLLLGILTEISLAPSTQLLPPLRDRLLAAEVRATKAVAKLAKTEHGAALKPPCRRCPRCPRQRQDRHSRRARA